MRPLAGGERVCVVPNGRHEIMRRVHGLVLCVRDGVDIITGGCRFVNGEGHLNVHEGTIISSGVSRRIPSGGRVADKKVRDSAAPNVFFHPPEVGFRLTEVGFRLTEASVHRLVDDPEQLFGRGIREHRAGLGH